jgi:hypothetical protein
MDQLVVVARALGVFNMLIGHQEIEREREREREGGKREESIGR